MHPINDMLPKMKVFQKNAELQNELFELRKKGLSIGLVPTMGALHEGHASLVKKCVAENDVTVVSVFVNPTQFNDKNDLKNYPRDLEKDCNLLEKVGADYVFAPSVEEMYPTPDTRQFEYPPVSTVMEGAHRPGHFNGVCQVVSRLFYIVRPGKAYFGEKDWQQIAVVKCMVKALALPVEIVECPIVRDDDNHSVEETHDKVVDTINAIDGLDVEYFAIVDGNTLQEVKSWDDSDYVVGCITVYCGKTPIRLIDHIKFS